MRGIRFLVCAALLVACGDDDASGTDGGGSGEDAGGARDAGSPRVDSGPRPDGGPDALPEGAEGIAARYPGDVGIDADDQVIFADDFESYADASQLGTRWDDVYHNLRIATEAGQVYAGS